MSRYICASLVAILTNFLCTQYPLFFGKSREHRQISRGTITIRLRKEIYDNRKALLAGVKPPLQTYVSVATENDFKVAHYTTEGGTFYCEIRSKGTMWIEVED